MRVAAIDCGTNSIRLLIADVDGQKLTDVVRTMVIVRLGEGVDQTGEFSQAALSRTFTAIDEFATIISQHKPEEIRFVATSASRDVSNRQEFADGIYQRLGVGLDVITGDEEAKLSFAGATSEILSGPDAPQTPVLVIDIGGGSTEFVIGTDEPHSAVSMNIGCVRMTERHLISDPPTDSEIQATIADVDQAIATANEKVDLSVARSIIGVAGSVTTVAALALELSEYDPQAIHGCRLTASAVHSISNKLLTMPREQRAKLGPMHEGRVDVIGGGALILDRIMHATGLSEIVVSEQDILDGIARDLANA